MRLRLGVLCVLAMGCGKGDDGTAPSVRILAPADGDLLNGETIDLVGLVSDADGVDDLVSVTWTSSADGLVAEDAFPDGDRSTATVTLTPGEHTLTLEAVDSLGLRGADVSTIEVEVGSNPTVSIVSPQGDDVFTVGDDIPLEATAAGGDTPFATIDGSWSVSVNDGALQAIASEPLSESGDSLATYAAADVGTYAFVLVLTDPDLNEVGRAEVTVDVLAVDTSDADADGFSTEDGDCDDTRADVYPGAAEVFDGVDNDCNGQIDEGSFTFDADGDCFCAAPLDEACTGSVSSACDVVQPGDCNDGDANAYPGAVEADGYTEVGGTYRGVDEDCDGEVNEGFASYDNDGDCYCEDDLACLGSSGACADDELAPGDCDDFTANASLRSPGAEEVLDGIDNNCDANTYIDEGTPVFDEDGDCFCEGQEGTGGCSDGVDRSCDIIQDGDCDETNPAINPDAVDTPEAATPFVDTNCDGIDGDVEESAFAIPSGSGVACTVDSPCLLATALSQSAPYVLVEQGGHVSPGTIDRDVIIVGGYTADFSSRLADPRATSLDGRAGPTLTVSGGAEVTLNYMQLRAPLGDSGRDRRTLVIDGSTLRVNGVDVVRGDGADGSSGFPGVSASTSRAPDGIDAIRETSAPVGQQILGPRNPDCTSVLVRGGAGGRTGTATVTGGMGSEPQGEQVTDGGAPNRANPRPESGPDGGTINGAGGVGGTHPGAGNDSGFVGGGAGEGTLGEHGRGGTGGGGTGGATRTSNGITIDLNLGYTGGTGAAGGCRAPTQGFPGASGGASVGIWNLEGTLVIDGVLSIREGSGGNGGEGGAPGRGQPGGLGGDGSPASTAAWSSGSGGDGGDGGFSGGGGGGRGGSVYGIVNLDGTVTGPATEETEPGQPGNGGRGGGQPVSSSTTIPYAGQPGVDGLSIGRIDLSASRR